LLWILLAVLGQTNYETTGKYSADMPENHYDHTYDYGSDDIDMPEDYHYDDETDFNEKVALCPAGHYADGGFCAPCPVGKIAATAGATMCLNCPAGKAAEATGQTACTVCAAGTFSIAGSGHCIMCWAGTYSADGSTQCTDCPSGTTSLPGSMSLSMCTTMTTAGLSEHEPEQWSEETDEDEKAPIANALELHNEAELAQERATEAQENADREINEANDAYEHKLEAEEVLHEKEERFEEVFTEKIAAEQVKHAAEVRYQEQAMEAQHAVEKSTNARAQSNEAALRAFEASHAVKMESEGEANEAVVQSKIEDEEHFNAQMQYREAEHHAMKENIEADEAQEAADKAVHFAEEQHAEAEMAEAKLLNAESHLRVQKEEADVAKIEAEKAKREHEIADAHHDTVLASKKRNEEVWEEMLADDCVDDPKGLVSSDPSKNCDDVGSHTHWSCDHFDEDFNGHATFIWELCPVTCDMCGTDRDRYYEEHHHHDDRKDDDMPECLKDCPFGDLDFEDAETACPWWHAEGPEHNSESCFNDCSPGVMFYVEHHVERVCKGGPDDNPFECAMDCPVEGLDPHSAESFCPWFSEEQNNMCFNDCTDKFLNMAQAHAEHTCVEFAIEGADKFTSYINEPLAEALVEYGESVYKCEGGFYRSAVAENECHVCPAAMFSHEGDYECTACPSGMTSFPGSKQATDCFVRASLPVKDSYDSESWDSDYKGSYDMDESLEYDIKEHEYDASHMKSEPEYHYDYENFDETKHHEPSYTGKYHYDSDSEDWETEASYQHTDYYQTTYPIAEERPIDEAEKFTHTETAVTGDYVYTNAPDYYNPSSEFEDEEYSYSAYPTAAMDDYSVSHQAAYTYAPETNYYPTAENEAELSYTGQPQMEEADLSSSYNN